MIAVVDDDESVRRAIVRLLRAAGYQAQGFSSAQELLEFCLSDAPECLLLDLQLPNIPGLELYRRLRQSGVRASAIAITADDEPRVRDECVAEGMSACLRKPLDAQALLAALARVNIWPDRGR